MGECVVRIMTGLVGLALAIGVAGCSQKGLRDLRINSNGPDEFLILPTKQLQQPPNYNTLPTPTPGQANLVDATPKQDMVAALGGNPTAMIPGPGIPAADGALVAQTARYGVDPDIRARLAESDAKFRGRARLSGRIRLFPVDRYKQIYRRESLDPFEQTEAYRRAGYQTPSSPPEN